jgi:hypothetical protein
MIEMFHTYFDDVARQETRYLNLLKDSDGIPAGSYAYLEGYCTDPTCDCRRVLLNVFSPENGVVAVIGFGFDRPARCLGRISIR